ncbi:hypothetical protein B0H67DRAFT_549614 [Lasiosphaeris hirsuta]|uniref:Uncharacterized protein n=1 Tax=Lasiosphaeris hirsuta TaxID=260670 RepID=A0AA40BD02_9PEZI|nr:hypothetical protein B0H67DRAFT_549614 [Lasiosphaeris hirsuta]
MEDHAPGPLVGKMSDSKWTCQRASYVAKFTRVRMKPEKALSTEGLSLDWFFELITDENNCIVGAKVKEEVISVGFRLTLQDSHHEFRLTTATKFIAELHSHQKCTDFIHDFLMLIRDELLIVETSKKYRFTSKQICTELNKMERKCDKGVGKRLGTDSCNLHTPHFKS